jgi:propionyl-CoA synthetase
MDYAEFHRRSIEDRDAFWAGQARLIDWQTPPQRSATTAGRPSRAGSRRHHQPVPQRGRPPPEDARDQPALIYVSTETGPETRLHFRELHAEVQRMAAVLQALGVQGRPRADLHADDREAAFAMLACARIGAIHSVVFGGFARCRWHRASRTRRQGRSSAPTPARAAARSWPYKPLLDEAIRLSSHKPQAVLMVDRGLAPMELMSGRDHDWAELTQRHDGAQVPCEWLDATDISYTIYTSGNHRPAQRRAARRRRLCGGLGGQHETHLPGRAGRDLFFATSDIGWVVGHSYIVYGPLLAGMATIMYEGLPIRPDAGIWWHLVEKYKVTGMFSAPTAVRV